MPLPNYNDEGVICSAFLDKVLDRFRAPTKVFTNQGMEFHGKFQKLCENTLIEHHMTSWNRPKANCLVE